jgi:hypothetical protein
MFSKNRLIRYISMLMLTIISITACSPTSSKTPANSLHPTSSPISPTAPSVLSTPTAAITVTTTLDGLTTLPHRIQWEAKPIDPDHQITEVDFLIDGQLAWVEHKAPYVYGSDDNYLVTSFLTPAEHSFAVRVLTSKGQSVDSTTVRANVAAAPLPPDILANTSWTRQVTGEDVKKATSEGPPPTGQWNLMINSVGWVIKTPVGGGTISDVAYQSNGQVELRPTIEEPPFPNDMNGAFCEEPDPPFLWSYAISNDGKTLTLHPVGNDPCGDRIAVLEGTWTHK